MKKIQLCVKFSGSRRPGKDNTKVRQDGATLYQEFSHVTVHKTFPKVMFFSVLCWALFQFTSCTPEEQDLLTQQSTDNDQLNSQNRKNLGAVSMPVTESLAAENMLYQQHFYVPIYSDIYASEQSPKILMTAILSIRNTSQTQSLYINDIDYFNTEGKLVKQVLTKPIKIAPMGTYHYNVEKQDDTGGSGANFLITTSAKQTIQPVIQAIMIGQYGNKAFAFSVDGVLAP